MVRLLLPLKIIMRVQYYTSLMMVQAIAVFTGYCITLCAQTFSTFIRYSINESGLHLYNSSVGRVSYVASFSSYLRTFTPSPLSTYQLFNPSILQPFNI